MSDKELLKTIQNDINKLYKCIETCDTDGVLTILKQFKQILEQKK